MQIIETITTSFSVPGARVLLAPWPAGDASREVDDREMADACDAVCAMGRDAAVVELVPTASSMDVDNTRRTVKPDERDGGHGQDGAAARAGLIITMLPPDCGEDGSAEAAAIAAARKLAFGGILAVYTHSDWSTGRLTDPSGPMIAAAQNADLLYLQHIVTLHTPIRNGRLQPPPERVQPVRDDTDVDGQELSSRAPHVRVHGDVLVFAQAHADAALSEDLR